jgi:hypothetical protein
MCTPGNMPPMCSCPHESALGVAAAVKWAAVAVIAAGIAWVVAAGYGAWLLLAGWLMLMGTCALVSQGRDRRARAAAAETVTLSARDYVREDARGA